MERIEVMAFEGGKKEWAQALAALGPCAPLQVDWAYGEIAAAKGRKLRRLAFWQGGRRIGLTQVVGRGPLWLVSRGPLFAPDLPEANQRAALRALARALRGVLIATPEAPLAGFGLVPLITARHHALWPLEAPEPTLRAALAGKWRNRLAQAERSGLRVAEEGDFDWLLRAEAAQRAERGYRALPPEFARAWRQARKGGTLCLSARNAAGARVAGVLMLRHGAGASYHIGWSAEEGRASGAHNLLLWQAALRLKARGVARLDLGDVNSEAGAGLMHFKLGTGASTAALGATVLVLPGCLSPAARLARER